jgi:hypothetical protein
MKNRTPFINKVLAYDHGNASSHGNAISYGDTLLGMGVRKLSFTMDISGKVICNSEFFDPVMVTNGIGASAIGTTSWFDMQGCINFCTSGIHAKISKTETVFVFDMSCSSNGTGIFKTVTPTRVSAPRGVGGPGGVGAPGGGGKQIKKKSGSMKKTRRVKNKSRTTRYIRNRRNRLKHNKRTKKSRKTKTNRKH